MSLVKEGKNPQAAKFFLIMQKFLHQVAKTTFWSLESPAYLLLRKTCHRLLYIITTNGHKSADLIYMTLILTYIKSGFDMCRKKKDDDCVETCLSIHVPMLRSKMSPSSRK